MRVLVTGGAGFIGQPVCARLLEQGAQVVVLDSMIQQVHGTTPPRLQEDVELHVADVRDKDSVRRAAEACDVLVHLAALTGVGQSMYRSSEYADVNGVGTSTVLAAAADAEVARVVLSSSRAVYGEGMHRCPRGHTFTPGPRVPARLLAGSWDHFCPTCGESAAPVPTREDSSLRTGSVYGATKEFQEQLVGSMCPASGVDFLILRYFNVYGAGQAVGNPYTGIMGVFATCAREGEPISLYEDGMMVRDFVHVSDVAEATVAAVVGGPELSGATLNVGLGEASTISEIASAIAELEGAPSPVVTGQYRVGDVRHCYADTALATGVLGFEARIGLREGLTEYLEWHARQPVVAAFDATSELARYGFAGSAGNAP